MRLRFKFAAQNVNEKVEIAPDGKYVALENISSWTGQYLPNAIEQEPSSQTNRFASSDVLFGKLRPYLAKVWLARFEGFASTECLVLRGRQLIPEYLRYWCLSEDFIDLVNGSTFGSKMPRADWEFIGNTIAVVPPVARQSAIAAYLDCETAKIDLLIAKKRELIEKLKEQRSALISGTVTRGLPPEAAKAADLNPNPPMKYSGVAWLGDVPEHWGISRIKMIAKVGNGSTPSREEPAYWDEEGFPWLNSSVVNREVVSDSDQYVTERALRECHLPKVAPPAVLVGITGEGRTRGMASTLLIEATINQHLAFVKPFPARVNVNYLRRVFDACYQYLRSESGGGGSTKGAITCEQIAALGVAIPPLAEQDAIVVFLDTALIKLTKTQALVESAIARLSEYRAALITAAVTGQIDIAVEA